MKPSEYENLPCAVKLFHPSCTVSMNGSFSLHANVSNIKTTTEPSCAPKSVALSKQNPLH